MEIKQDKEIKQEILLDEKLARGVCFLPARDEQSGDMKDMTSVFRKMVKVPRQTHSLNVGIVENDGQTFDDVDALVTFTPEIPIGVFTADCVPILMFATDVAGVAAVHAGWKGTIGGIIDCALDILEQYGAKPENILVAFGPSISSDSYEVGEDLADRFREAGFGDSVSYPIADSRPHIDLQGVNIERLLRRGIRTENIRPHAGCSMTSHAADGSPLYCSHRRSAGNPARMLTSIMLLRE